MEKLRTMQEILDERIAQRVALAGNSQAMMEEANKQLMAVSKRMDADPTLGTFANMWAEAMVKVIRWNPPVPPTFIIQQVIAQLVMDWDSIKATYDDQFQTHG
jgi:hypothetical protein